MKNLGPALLMIGLMGLGLSYYEEQDAQHPPKPLPKEVDQAMTERLKHTNGLWFSSKRKG